MHVCNEEEADADKTSDVCTGVVAAGSGTTDGLTRFKISTRLWGTADSVSRLGFLTRLSAAIMLAGPIPL